MSRPAFASLRVRLLAFAALASGLALAASWVGLSLLFERHVERQVGADLIRQGQALAAAVALDRQGRPRLSATPADPRFARPASGLYWRVATSAGEVRSRSLWDGRWTPWPEAAPSAWRIETTAGPFEARIIRTARLIRPQADAPPVLIEVAVTHEAVSAARAGFAGELAPFLGLLWAALMAAALVQVMMGLRPLNRVRTDLAGLHADPAARLDPDTHPREVAPLAAAINALADARARDMEAARHRARDLAHALKTPLAALRLQIEDLPPPERADAAQALAVLTDAVQAELARAGAARAAAGTCLLAPLIARLLAVMRRSSDAAGCAVSVSVPDGFVVPLEETVAMEVFGALLDNALRHARSRISVMAEVRAGARWVVIEDDGPGLAPQQRAAALTRGVRLDEAGGTAGLAAGSGGQGLGLSIARAYAEASGGRLDLDAAALGGLTVRLLWLAAPAAESV